MQILIDFTEDELKALSVKQLTEVVRGLNSELARVRVEARRRLDEDARKPRVDPLAELRRLV